MSEHAADHSVLKLFHPAIQNWFSGIGRPTEIQSLSWPHIAEGKHCLISAPTGSGKTLTAFLWSINRFLTGELKTGQTRILYISPLKALNNDIRENLLLPLQQLQAEVEQSGEYFPLIRVQTRSGDTDSNARRQMLRQPPDILITTPESLNLLLSSRSGISLLDQLDTVILDELHSLLGNKRGTYLMSAIERLVPLSGEFQRIALSATIEPMSVAARFLGGYRCEDADSPVPSYIARDVQILQGQGAGQKSYEVNVLYPDRLHQHATDKTLWDYLAEELLDVIARNRSTLIFVNSRALCEKLTLKVNTAAKRVVAYAHHGSLSKELRKEVEQRLKQGELAAIIATSSLEMGIDIGALDEVVLIQTVDAMASAIQRIGRAGHRVGEVSKGLFLPTHAQDFLETAVLAEAVLNKTIEPLKPVQCPLDVLAQVIISCTAIQSWPLTTLYNQLRCCSAYHDLSREQFDLVLNMLAGQYSDNRIRELQRRINVDRIAQTATATKGAVLTLYQAGGVIPDRGYFHLRHQDSSAKIGELDEEFVWETRVGQTFTLGTQNWQIQRITHNDVFVLPGKRGPTPPPFWKAESLNRNVHFSARIGIFLERINTDLSESKESLDPLINQLHHRYLQSEYALDLSASRALLTFLVEQRQHTGVELPHQHHIVIEEVHSFLGYQQGRQIVLHTFWGAPLNRPLALALEAAWQKQFGEQIEIFSSNDCLVLQLPHGIAAEQLLHLVAAEQLESLLRQRLEGSGFFGARFRECAGRALLLSKGQFNQRHPLWMSRLQSQKLLDVVRSAADFPILLETWRTCFQDEFDLPGLRTKLEQLDSGAIRWSLCSVNTPSPMAKNIGWDQVNQYMYMDDTPKNQAASSLSDQLLQSLVFDTESRPQIPLDIIAAFNTKRQRLSAGYAPDSPSELLEWVKERLIIPAGEWRALRAAMAQEYGPTTPDEFESALVQRLSILEVNSPLQANENKISLVVANEQLFAITQLFYANHEYLHYPITQRQDHDDSVPGSVSGTSPCKTHDNAQPLNPELTLSTWLLQWLSFYGPMTVSAIQDKLNLDPHQLEDALLELVEEDRLIAGNLIQTDQDLPQYCERKNVEILIYLARQHATPAFEAKPLNSLPAFLFDWQLQGIHNEDPLEALANFIGMFCGYPAPAGFWEQDLLPSRLPDYDPLQLDHLFNEADIQWRGTGERQITFGYSGDLEILAAQEVPDTLAELGFTEITGRYPLGILASQSGKAEATLLPELWRCVWRGQISNDSIAALRKGLQQQFKDPSSAPSAAPGSYSSRRLSQRPSQRLSQRRFKSWKQGLSMPGNWYSWDNANAIPEDLNLHSPDQLELEKDRVRVLLARYGILFRELLQKELPEFRWGRVFRALRLMELTREVLTGHFFEDIPGLQFIDPTAFRRLQQTDQASGIYWLSAIDPLSFCGSALKPLKHQRPKRLDTTHLVFRGVAVVMISFKLGKVLEINIAPDDPDLPDVLNLLHHLLYREPRTANCIEIETINDQTATDSPYLPALQAKFDVFHDHRKVTLQRRLE